MKIQNISCTAAVLVFLLAGATPSAMAADHNGMLKAAEVKALVHNVKSPADHLKLASHFNAMANKHEAEAKEHEALAAEYTKTPTGQEMKHPMSGQTAEHCRYYAEHCRKAAAEMRSMAAAHTAMAKNAK